MSAATLARSPKPDRSIMEIVHMFPAQGEWEESDYLSLDLRTKRLCELSNGHIEVLPLPTSIHQETAFHLCTLFVSHLRPNRLGKAVMAPYPVRLRKGKMREPDVVVMLAENLERMGVQYSDGADIVVEVLSKDRNRDLIRKRAEYAKARIGEYWIVDLEQERIVVLWLSGRRYTVHGIFHPGDLATSPTLEGFAVDVEEVMAIGTDGD
jgi:Uma2 family endonuclease